MPMIFSKKDIVISHDLAKLTTGEMDNYVAHIICEQGSYGFLFAGKPFVLKQGEAMISTTNSEIETPHGSADLKVRCIYISATFLEVATPKSNYGILGTLELFKNPVMRPDEYYFDRLRKDFSDIEERLSRPHGFLDDIMICYVQAMFLDFFHIHSTDEHSQSITDRSAALVRSFIALLEQGEYIKHREISYYADKLFVTPKHLSDMCKKISGFSANYWIIRFTTIHIRRLLKERSMTLTEIADLFEFSSQAYFNRFVQRNLGASPSAFRR